MILKSFQILAICTSMAVTPSNFHYDQVKKTDNSIPYTMEIDYDNIGQNIITIDGNSKVKNIKYSKTVSNDAFQITTQCYTNTYFNDSSNLTFTYTNLNQYSTSMLYVLQITPYNRTINNQLTINLRYGFKALFPDEPSLVNTYNTTIKQYSSIDSYWNKYVDLSSINNPTLNYDAIADITNSQLGFIYTETTYNTTMTEVTRNYYALKTIDTQITIDPNKVNYIYYYIYNTWTPPQGQESATATGCYLVDGMAFTPTTGNTGTHSLVLNGYIYPPVGNYEVVDIPGIMWEVLSMPFTFISIAFNLTLFPNTPYQVNLSNLFLSILGAIIFIFIMSKFVFKK